MTSKIQRGPLDIVTHFSWKVQHILHLEGQLNTPTPLNAWKFYLRCKVPEYFWDLFPPSDTQANTSKVIPTSCSPDPISTISSMCQLSRARIRSLQKKKKKSLIISSQCIVTLVQQSQTPLGDSGEKINSPHFCSTEASIIKRTWPLLHPKDSGFVNWPCLKIDLGPLTLCFDDSSYTYVYLT